MTGYELLLTTRNGNEIRIKSKWDCKQIFDTGDYIKVFKDNIISQTITTNTTYDAMSINAKEVAYTMQIGPIEMLDKYL